MPLSPEHKEKIRTTLLAKGIAQGCRKCGGKERCKNGKNETCADCARRRNRKWLSANTEKRNATRRAAYAANPEMAATLRAASRAANRDWERRNPGKTAARLREWRKRNPESEREKNRRWRQGHRDTARAIVWRRRARLLGATISPINAEGMAGRRAMFGGNCWRCGQPATEMDHVKPLSKNGPHCLSNLRPICSPCNKTKLAKWPFDTSHQQG